MYNMKRLGGLANEHPAEGTLLRINPAFCARLRPHPAHTTVMANRLLLTTIVLLLAAEPVHAQVRRGDPLLDRLVGKWTLSGPMAGKPVLHDVTARWVLDAEYVEIHEVSRDRKRNGAPAYEAIVYVGRDSATREYAALWLDNTAYGAFAPAGTGHGFAAGDSIAFVFTSSPTSHVYNTFKYDAKADTWEWHLDNEDDGKRTMFARVTLTR